ncbi:hypothetical protein LAZ67_X002229 [Cordylochernes scorpioides]|uniref:Reverse transcriptase RNase H-like domain-containing protein n=1 Tax=Cordylochernes scorpioides TaxID=51811 RepID=A0ABY6LWF0_9ARAC|nr:hypothetical protein LAZ67_X002229 [Cordylochernes scorpioides]
MMEPLRLKSELDLFSGLPIQVAIENSDFEEVHPIATLSDGPIEFYIPGTFEHYIDPSFIFLQLAVKISKRDGSALAATDKVGPINYLLNTAFENVEVFLNEKQIVSQNNYGYRSILDALLNFPENAQKTFLKSSLFEKDTAKYLDETDPNGNNLGLKARHAVMDLNKEITLFGAMNLDLSFQHKLLLNGVSLKIRLHRAKNSFVLMFNTQGFVLKITKASLLVRKVTVSPSAVLAHNKTLENGVAKYPIRKVDVKTLTIPSGTHSTILPNLFLGPVPNRIVIGFVTNGAYSGDFTKNPFNFQNFNINYISLKIGQRVLPNRPLTPQFSEGEFYRSYVDLFSNMGRYLSSGELNITPEEFQNGLTLFAFDTTLDLCASDLHSSVTQNSNISLEVKFSSALTSTINVILYSEFQSKIHIDKLRQVVENLSYPLLIGLDLAGKIVLIIDTKDKAVYFKENECFSIYAETHLPSELQKELKAINEFPQPKTVKQVRQYLGLASYHRKFIPKFSEIADPLTSLTRKNKLFKWTSEVDKSFQKLKFHLSTNPVLTTYDPSLPFQSAEYFEVYLENNTFEVITDHSALEWLFNIKKPKVKFLRWIVELSTNFVKKSHIHQDLIMVKHNGALKAVVPESFQEEILKECHDNHSHPSINKTKLDVSQVEIIWKIQTVFGDGAMGATVEEFHATKTKEGPPSAQQRQIDADYFISLSRWSHHEYAPQGDNDGAIPIDKLTTNAEVSTENVSTKNSSNSEKKNAKSPVTSGGYENFSSTSRNWADIVETESAYFEQRRICAGLIGVRFTLLQVLPNGPQENKLPPDYQGGKHHSTLEPEEQCKNTAPAPYNTAAASQPVAFNHPAPVVASAQTSFTPPDQEAKALETEPTIRTPKPSTQTDLNIKRGGINGPTAARDFPLAPSKLFLRIGYIIRIGGSEKAIVSLPHLRLFQDKLNAEQRLACLKVRVDIALIQETNVTALDSVENLCLGYRAEVVPASGARESSLSCIISSGVQVIGQRVLFFNEIAVIDVTIRGIKATFVNCHLYRAPYEQLQAIAAAAVNEDPWVLEDLNISEEFASDIASGSVESAIKSLHDLRNNDDDYISRARK